MNNNDDAATWRKVAVLDGPKGDQSVHLYLESEMDDRVEEMPWPEGWPSWVTLQFLREQGFRVEVA